MTLNLLVSGLRRSLYLFFKWNQLRKKKISLLLYYFLIIVIIFIVVFLKPNFCVGSMFSQFSKQPHISVYTIEGSDRMQEHLLKLHSPSQLHLANSIKSLLIWGLFEETGCHFVSFRIHPNFVGSGRNIWLELKYFQSTACKSVCSKCGLNADRVGRSVSPSAIVPLKRYHLFDGIDIQGWSQNENILKWVWYTTNCWRFGQGSIWGIAFPACHIWIWHNWKICFQRET